MKLQEALNTYGDKKLKDIVQVLTSNDKVATGRLNQSWRFEQKSNPDNLNFILEFFAEPYALNVIYGRKPGTIPNVDNLKVWAEARGISSQKLYHIIRKIYTSGIQPDSSVNQALQKDELFLDLTGILNEAGKKELQEQIDEIIKEFSKYNN